MSDDPPVTAESPDSAISVTGTDHISIIGSNEEDTVAFYRDILGMPLVLRQPNLDDPSMTHLFFDTGDGRMVTFFCLRSTVESRRPTARHRRSSPSGLLGRRRAVRRDQSRPRR